MKRQILHRRSGQDQANETWRLFAAIALSPAATKRVAEAITCLQHHGWRAKWVDPVQSHITIKFYGDVPVSRVAALQAALTTSVQASQTFTLQVAGAGVFPSPQQPRVVWLGVTGDLTGLQTLYEHVEHASVKLGYPPERRPFHPHITLARLRPETPIPQRSVETALQELDALPPVTIPVTALTLYRSILQPAGPMYTVLCTVPLGGER